MQAQAITRAVTERLALGAASAADLMQVLGVSQSTLSRAMRVLERDHRVLRIGSTRGARYALRRPVETIGSQWPVYRIDNEGAPHEIGELHALALNSYHLSGGPERISYLAARLPYFLQDARPAGFLGRTIPAAYPELELPPRVIDWTDEHFLVYLTQRGVDSSGDLIVGVESLNRHLGGVHAPAVVPEQNRHAAYPKFAADSMAGAPPGNSANGEHPKFTVSISSGERRTHVIVKFSPPRSTPIGQRWADLLTAEYLAHRALEAHGITACRSALFDYDDRTFLECERFDRIGSGGRRGVVSLFALDTSLYGKLDNWSAAANRLAADALLRLEDAEHIRLLDTFGALTANTDRHFGNLMLFDRYEGPFELAPAYDMLPMLFAPQDGQIVARQFEPPPPTAAALSVWPRAYALAESYWNRLARDTRISIEFRDLSAHCLAALRASRRHGVPAKAP
jgi:hypothetical protein